MAALLCGCRGAWNNPATPILSRAQAPIHAVQPAIYDEPPAMPSAVNASAVAEHTQPKRLPALPEVALAAYDEVVQDPPSVQPESVDAGVPLTLESFEQIALSNSPAVAEAAAEMQAAYGNWLQVGLPPNPSLGYSGQQLGSRGLAEQQGVFVGQEIVTGHKLRLNRNVASWELQRAERTLTIQQFRVLTDVRVAYCEVVLAQRRRDLARQLVEIGEQGTRAADSLFKAQEVSEADPLRARIEADAARIVLRSAENQYLAAWRTLAAAAGIADMLPAELPADFEPQWVDAPWEELLPQLLAESPEVAAAMADVESAHWAVHRAMAEVIPNLDVQAIIQHDNATQSSNGSLQVTMPIPLINRNQGRIQQAQGQLAAAQIAVDRVALDLQTRFADTFQRYSNAQHQVEVYTLPGGTLENARRTMDLIRSGYQAGEFSVLDLLTAQRTYFQTNLAYLDSLRDLWTTSMEIRGMLLRGSLAQR